MKTAKPEKVFNAALVRAASECKEIGRRLLGVGVVMDRIGRTGKALEIYSSQEAELRVCNQSISFQLLSLLGVSQTVCGTIWDPDEFGFFSPQAVARKKRAVLHTPVPPAKAGTGLATYLAARRDCRRLRDSLVQKTKKHNP